MLALEVDDAAEEAPELEPAEPEALELAPEELAMEEPRVALEPEEAVLEGLAELVMVARFENASVARGMLYCE